ncbi:MAG TPA: alpha/beta fold hydrolase [Alphaproteobacteria bacterium]
MTPPFRHPPLLSWQIDAPHHFVGLGRFALESGAAIEDFHVCYVTHGRLSAARDNVILVCPAIGQTHHRLDFLIGPGRALDTDRYFVVAIDAIGNGLTTSPSTSRRQPHGEFPRFSIRDMVAAQHAVLVGELGIERLVAVVGASMGGMQALQWAVSHSAMMDAIVAMTPMARTTPWSVAVNETCRAALMADPSWDGSQFRTTPVRGLRAWTGVLRMLANRTPMALAADCPDAAGVRGYFDRLAADTIEMKIDPLDWIYQSYAYDAHDVAAEPRFDGDLAKALARVRARTLILGAPFDLYNPIEAARTAAGLIPRAEFLEIPSILGHQAAGASSAEAEFLNRSIAAFLRAL